MTKAETALRQAVIDTCLWMNASGLNQGTSGNISVRHGEQMLITPSATPYDAMRPEMLASMMIDGADDVHDGPMRPSTEWRFHRDILRARPDVGTVVHAHPIHCTTLAIARREIPPVHYMIAAFGGANIRCAGYALFGTQALSDLVIRALEDRMGCLMANHGMIVVGPDLEKAAWLATELETLARQYVNTLSIGGPVLLSDAEIAEARAAFGSYGLRDAHKTAATPRSRRKRKTGVQS